MTLINGFINASVIFVSLVFVDKIGRKTLLLAGAGIQLAGLLAMGRIGTIHSPTVAEKTAIVAMLSVFSFGFAIGWAPLAYVVTTELPALHLRDQSQRVASLVNVVTA
jgi:MFS family permease